MNQIIFNSPEWRWDDDGNAHDILNQKRGQNRRMTHGLIVIETLRAISGGKPTRDQLQKFSKIRRKRFIVVLKHLIEIESVKRTGSGTKFDPYLYELGEKEIRRK